MSKNVWERDLNVEARGKSNFMYRVGFLFGILLTWGTVGTGLITFGNLSIAAVVLVIVFTIMDARKMWKGK